jgi:hypothetical protein
MQQPFIFVYDSITSSKTEELLNAKHIHSAVCAEHLAIPTILQKHGYDIKIESIKNIDKLEQFYYVITYLAIHQEVFNKNIKSFIQLVDPVVIKAINEKRCKIILSTLPENTGPEISINKFLSEIKRLGLTNDNTLIACNGNDKILTSNIVSFNFFESVAKHVLLNKISDQAYIQRIYNIKNKCFFKKFLCFNRVPRFSRLLLTYFCWKNNLLSNMNYSFLAPVDELKKRYSLTKQENFIKNEEEVFFTPSLIKKEDRKKFYNVFPLLIDDKRLYHTLRGHNTSYDHWDLIDDPHVYNNGIFIVTETIYHPYTWKDTDVYGNNFKKTQIISYPIMQTFLTEKMYKPIVFKMPFITVSQPHTLRYLRNNGYKTFNELWDESYDEERNPVERMKKIIDLLNHLNNIKEKEFYDLLLKAQDIADYNYNILKKREPEKTFVNCFLNFAKK